MISNPWPLTSLELRVEPPQAWMNKKKHWVLQKTIKGAKNLLTVLALAWQKSKQ